MIMEKKVDPFGMTLGWDGAEEVLVLDENGNIIDREDLESADRNAAIKKFVQLEDEMYRTAAGMEPRHER